jgi:hypothetical protein
VGSRALTSLARTVSYVSVGERSIVYLAYTRFVPVVYVVGL